MAEQKKCVIHMDLDYFFAQAEELRKPELKGKPVVVCVYSGRTETSGSVATCNYNARRLGIRSGMPIFRAMETSKEAVFLPVDFEYYRKLSGKIQALLHEYSDKIEFIGLDEATLDITEKANSLSTARLAAHEIKERILEATGLTCSVGVATSRVVAKIAANQFKPDGFCFVDGGKEQEFLSELPVDKISGIGKKTSLELECFGIRTIGQLASKQPFFLVEKFGKKKGNFLFLSSHGIDSARIEHRERQQFSRIVTLKLDAETADAILPELEYISDSLHSRLASGKKHFKTVTAIFITVSLDTETRGITLPNPSNEPAIILENAKRLAEEYFSQGGRKIRRLGIRVSGFDEPLTQKKLWDY